MLGQERLLCARSPGLGQWFLPVTVLCFGSMAPWARPSKRQMPDPLVQTLGCPAWDRECARGGAGAGHPTSLMCCPPLPGLALISARALGARPLTVPLKLMEAVPAMCLAGTLPLLLWSRLCRFLPSCLPHPAHWRSGIITSLTPHADVAPRGPWRNAYELKTMAGSELEAPPTPRRVGF